VAAFTIVALLPQTQLAQLLQLRQQLLSSTLRASESSTVASPTPFPTPLQKYAIEEAERLNLEGSPLTIVQPFETADAFTSYLFTYRTMCKTMSGLMHVPRPLPKQPAPVLILVRGYVPPETYQPGAGTKRAAEVFAQHGYVTFAPDFLGYGSSDPDFENNWESRFTKPLQLIELIKSLRALDAQIPLELPLNGGVQSGTAGSIAIDATRLGLWAHSNGGQITLTALEILRDPIPTTLWAPVTAPFPYSILFFSDEQSDEGKAMRADLQLFEKAYDVFDFSLTQHLDRLRGAIQLHHGLADEAALIAWSDEFRDRLKSAQAELPRNQRVELTYYRYPDTDHNMRPAWDQVISRDLTFFEKQLERKTSEQLEKKVSIPPTPAPTATPLLIVSPTPVSSAAPTQHPDSQQPPL
jgi:hypothetical protein